MSAVIVGALATIGAALVAHLEFGGRRELREITAMVGAAVQLEKSDQLRERLLKDAAGAHTTYRRHVTLRRHLLLAVALGTSLFGVILVFAAIASQPHETDIKTPYAVAALATLGFVVSLFGVAVASICLLAQIWMDPGRSRVFRLGWTVVLTAIASAIVYLVAANLMDLPGFLAATTP
ncbi:MAG: hypothetical protein HGA51_06595 [Demequinaceae bacterium]|nr:hypothetical protein [Demequinaceae bacterium]